MVWNHKSQLRLQLKWYMHPSLTVSEYAQIVYAPEVSLIYIYIYNYVCIYVNHINKQSLPYRVSLAARFRW